MLYLDVSFLIENVIVFFKLQLLTHFLTDLLRTWIAHCPIYNL